MFVLTVGLAVYAVAVTAVLYCKTKRAAAAWRAGFNGGRRAVIVRLADILAENAAGPFDRQRAINDLAAALNGKEEDYNAECGSHPGASGC